MSTSAPIAMSGIATGIDTSSMVDKLMQIEAQPVQIVQSNRSQASTQLDHLRALSTRFGALSSAATALMGMSSAYQPASYMVSPFSAQAATSSDAATFTVTTGAGAVAGSYSMEVVSLATSQRAGGGAFNATHGSGVLHIGSADVAITADMSAQAVADAINNTSGSGMAASLLNGELMLVGKKTGAAENYTVSADGGLSLGDLGLDPSPDDVAGADATIKLAGKTITSASNVFSGALSGVTLTAQAVGAGKTLTVAPDTSGAVTKMQALVKAYNDIVGQIQTDTHYDASTKTGGVLVGDAFTQGLSDQLSQALSGLVGGAGSLNNYTQAGLSVARDGTLSLDTDKLKAALGTNPNDVFNLFAKDGGVAQRIYKLADQLTNPTSMFNPMVDGKRLPGALLNRIQSSTSIIAAMDTHIADMNKRLDVRRAYLNAQFTRMETAVSNLRNQGSYLSSMLSSS